MYKLILLYIRLLCIFNTVFFVAIIVVHINRHPVLNVQVLHIFKSETNVYESGQKCTRV